MQELYKKFFETCEAFDKFVQEQKWKYVKNKADFKVVIDNEFAFWTRVLKMLPPEKRLVKEFEWMKQCYEQIKKNLENEKVNWKLRWLHDDDSKDVI
ncbi:MAG: hypothetical protein PHF86_08715 [Candidatus Nanoarchaeia archaeon]|jgi:hypothetical protein|nr:hypothetical protein [Candidatus Nanoarchaeia archaeon]